MSLPGTLTVELLGARRAYARGHRWLDLAAAAQTVVDGSTNLEDTYHLDYMGYVMPARAYFRRASDIAAELGSPFSYTAGSFATFPRCTLAADPTVILYPMGTAEEWYMTRAELRTEIATCMILDSEVAAQPIKRELYGQITPGRIGLAEAFALALADHDLIGPGWLLPLA